MEEKCYMGWYVGGVSLVLTLEETGSSSGD